MKVAIMQPYFIPYTGYFRLFSHADLFVILDDVQFPREGWVHRNRLLNNNNQYSWLTLPLRKAPLETLINKMVFAETAAVQFDARLLKFNCLQVESFSNNSIVRKMRKFELPLIDYLELILKDICKLLNIEFNTIRSSELKTNKSLKGTDRVFEIVKITGASTYINSPGGKHLYDAECFDRKNIKLEFLPDWKGDNSSILQRILTENVNDIRSEILTHAKSNTFR